MVLQVVVDLVLDPVQLDDQVVKDVSGGRATVVGELVLHPLVDLAGTQVVQPRCEKCQSRNYKRLHRYCTVLRVR